MIEKGRYQGIEVANRTCDMQRVEDEYHFLLECPKYDDLRREYLPQYYVNYPNRCKYLNLISTEKDIELQTLSIFVYKSFNLCKSCSAKLSWTTEQ